MADNLKKVWSEYAKVYDEVTPLIEVHQKLMQKTRKGLEGSTLVLDQGCGTGILSRILCEDKKKIYAVDLNEAMLAHAIKRGPESIDYSLQDVRFLKFKDEFFEGAACINVAYSVEDYIQLFKEAYRVLKPKGKYVVNCLKPGFGMRDIEPIILDNLHRKGLLEKLKPILEKGKELARMLTDYSKTRLDEKMLVESLVGVGFNKIIYSDNSDYAGLCSFAVAEK
jgi:ubiquinone/menaquinone biosynthesis C-methylase UbiE